MAGSGSDFTIKFKASTKELDAANKKLSDMFKKMDSQTTKRSKTESTANKTEQRIKEANQKKQDNVDKQHERLRQQAHKTELKRVATIAKENKKYQDSQLRYQKTFMQGLGGGGTRPLYNANKFGRGSKDEYGNRGPILSAGGLGGATRAVLGAAGVLAGGALGLLIGGVVSGYHKYVEREKSYGSSVGLGKVSNMKRGVGFAGSSLGFSGNEAAAQINTMARATGVTGARELQQGMRSSGMGEGEVGETFGALRAAGFSFAGGGKDMSGASTKAGSQGGRELAKIIGLGTYSGLEKGRVPEFVKGVSQLVTAQFATAGGKVDAAAIAGQLAALGKVGGVGFQGQRGVEMMGKLNDTITNPGGGEWGKMLMLRAEGYGARTNGQGLYGATKAMEKGIRDPANVERMMAQLDREGRDPHTRNMMGEAMSSGQIKLEQWEQLFTARAKGGLNSSTIKGIVKDNSLEAQAMEQYKEMNSTLTHIASRENLMEEAGATAQPIVEALENFEQQIFSALMDIAKGIKNIYDFIKNAFGGSKELKDSISKTEKYNNAVYGATSLTDLRKRQNMSSQAVMDMADSMNNRSLAARVSEAVYGEDSDAAARAREAQTHAGAIATRVIAKARKLAGVSDTAPLTATEREVLASEAHYADFRNTGREFGVDKKILAGVKPDEKSEISQLLAEYAKVYGTPIINVNVQMPTGPATTKTPPTTKKIATKRQSP